MYNYACICQDYNYRLDDGPQISVTNSTAMSFDINSPKIRSPMRPKLTEDDLGMAERRFDPGESPIVYKS